VGGAVRDGLVIVVWVGWTAEDGVFGFAPRSYRIGRIKYEAYGWEGQIES